MARRPLKEVKAEANAIQEAIEAPIDDPMERIFVAAINAPAKAMSQYLDKPEFREVSLKLVYKAASLFGTQAEIASLFDLPEATLSARLQRDVELREHYDQGRAHAKLSLRRKQNRLADYNSGMAIFLGKNYLGQRDEKHLDVKQKKEIEHSVKMDLNKLDTDDLKRLTGILGKMAPVKEDDAIEAEVIELPPDRTLDGKPD